RGSTNCKAYLLEIQRRPSGVRAIGLKFVGPPDCTPSEASNTLGATTMVSSRHQWSISSLRILARPHPMCSQTDPWLSKAAPMTSSHGKPFFDESKCEAPFFQPTKPADVVAKTVPSGLTAT